MVRSWPSRLTKAVSGSVVLLQQGSVSMSVTPVTTKGQEDAHDLGRYRITCRYLRAVLPRETCSSEWLMLPLEDMGTSEPRLLLGDISDPLAASHHT